MPAGNIEQVVRDIPQLQLRAEFVPGTFNDDDRTVEVVWSTGMRGLRYDWEIGRYYEELSMKPGHVSLERMNAGASVLNSHQRWDLSSVMGAVMPGTAVVDGKEGRAKVQFSTREDVKPFVDDVKAGIIRHISVGYSVNKYQLIEGGLEGEIPVYRAIDWEPAEISFVPVPFDFNAQVRSAGEGKKPEQPEGVRTNQCVFINRGAAASNGGAIMPEEVKTEAAAPNAPQADIEQREAAARAAGAAAERQRQADIRTAVAVLPQAERGAFEAEMINGNHTADQVRAKVLEKLATSPSNATETRNTARVDTVEDETDKFVRGASDWLVQRSGVADRLGDAGKNLQPGQFRGMSLIELARHSLELRGFNTRGMDKMTLVGNAFTFRSGMNTTSDFAVLLENTMHKLLLASFMVTPDTWTRFCAIGSVSDFRAHNRYQMGSFGSLDSLNEAGEFKNKQIPDAHKESITAATKGNIIAISRQSIVNDDMNAFAQLAAMFGRAAKLSVEVDVYAAIKSNAGLGPLLSDGKTLFHADHGNINATGSALSVDGLDADRVVMASQTDYNGNEILDIRPAALLVPIGLGGNARVINDAQYDPDTANKLQKPNMVRGLFRDVVDTARLTGTRRYLFADANEAAVLEVAFLDGQREPVLETQDGWRIDGTEMKVRYDYAVAGVGYKGAVTNAGA